jgi:hypothetical protein
VKPNIAEVLLAKGIQDCWFSPVSYITLSCKLPPSRIFKGENAAPDWMVRRSLDSQKKERKRLEKTLNEGELS